MQGVPPRRQLRWADEQTFLIRPSSITLLNKNKTDESAAKGYMSLVNHALAQSEIGVRQVGQRLQHDLRGHSRLEVRRVELVPAEI